MKKYPVTKDVEEELDERMKEEMGMKEASCAKEESEREEGDVHEEQPWSGHDGTSCLDHEGKQLPVHDLDTLYEPEEGEDKVWSKTVLSFDKRQQQRKLQTIDSLLMLLMKDENESLDRESLGTSMLISSEGRGQEIVFEDMSASSVFQKRAIRG